MMPGRFYAPNVSPGKGERLDMNSLDGESVGVGLVVVTSGGERREAPLLGLKRCTFYMLLYYLYDI